MAFTTVPSAGAKLRASVLSALMAERTPIHAAVTVNQDLATSSTVLQNVTEIAVAIAANTTYIFEVNVAAVNAAGTAEDIKFSFTGPSGCTVHLMPVGPGSTITSSGVAENSDFAAAPSMVLGTTTREFGLTTSNTVCKLSVKVINGSTAGTLQLQAAQNTSGGNKSTIVAGSWMVGWQVA